MALAAPADMAAWLRDGDSIQEEVAIFTAADFSIEEQKRGRAPPSLSTPSTRSESDLSDTEWQEAVTPTPSAEGFRHWLEERPAMSRLGAMRCATGIAWDFPLAKSEKRELLLQHFALGEQMAEENASEAVRLAQCEVRQHRKSLESAKMQLNRRRSRLLFHRFLFISQFIGVHF
eukprot:g28592.t1